MNLSGSTFLYHLLRSYLHLYLLVLVLRDLLLVRGLPYPLWGHPVPEQADKEMVILTLSFSSFSSSSRMQWQKKQYISMATVTASYFWSRFPGQAHVALSNNNETEQTCDRAD